MIVEKRSWLILTVQLNVKNTGKMRKEFNFNFKMK